jgi:hypothetical protein
LKASYSNQIKPNTTASTDWSTSQTEPWHSTKKKVANATESTNVLGVAVVQATTKRLDIQTQFGEIVQKSV